MFLSKLANKEVINFLRSVTIKNGYFASQMQKYLVADRYQDSISNEQNPYYIHITGEYIVPSGKTYEVIDPVTKKKINYRYGRSQLRFVDENTTPSPVTPLFIDEDDPSAENSKLEYGIVKVNKKAVYTEFDELMFVTSLDTGTEIPFTRKMLHGGAKGTDTNGRVVSINPHSKTLEAYKIPGRYFDALCEKYPKQIDLIKSIVYFGSGTNVTTLQDAVDAEHLTMISYDGDILEERERVNIIDTINGYLDVLRIKWDTREYTYEDHYADVFWSIVWTTLPLVIVAKRYENIGTYDVHSSHVWHQLTSKGLDTFQGYLTPEQEWYLYKNIKYMRDRGGQQKILNLLIDNILNKYKLTIQSKNLALDYSKSLQETSQPDPGKQCEACARRGICNKLISSYKCPDFIGTKDTCKANPVIIGEDIHGGNRSKIISSLIQTLGITESEATERYERSLMWKDDVVNNIALELDKDQSIDLTKDPETIPEIVDREYMSGIEPSNAEGVSESQAITLREARATHTPTKLLEIIEVEGSFKYEELFVKYITNTLLNLSVDVEDKLRINTNYKITVGEAGYVFSFTFKEAIAALYLGLLHEELVETSVDDVVTVYGHKILKKDYLTNMHEDPTFDITIPTRAWLMDTFKSGVPVTQDMLANAYMDYLDEEIHDDDSEYREMSGITDSSVVFLNINDIYYAVKPDAQSKWDGVPYSFTVLGYIYQESWYKNNGEIAIIPKYFYLKIASDTHKYTTIDGGENVKGRRIVDGETAVILDKTKFSEKHELASYIDIDYVLKLYKEGLHQESTQSNLAEYFDSLFELFIYLESLRTGSGNARIHSAVVAFLESVMYHNKLKTFSLVSVAGKSQPTYSDWMDSNEDISQSFKSISNSKDRTALWDEFNIKLLDAILEGCTSAYSKVGSEDNRYKKLRQLVTSLSSYLTAYINRKDKADSYDETATVVSDIVVSDTEATNYIHFSDIGQRMLEAPINYDERELRNMLGIDDEHQLKVLRQGGVWYYAEGVDTTITKLVATFDADRDYTKKEEIGYGLYPLSLGYNRKDYIFYKEMEMPTVVWGELKTSGKLTSYMNERIVSVHYENGEEGDDFSKKVELPIGEVVVQQVV